MVAFRKLLTDVKKSSITVLLVTAIVGVFVFNNRTKLDTIEHGYCDNGVLVLQVKDQNLYNILDSQGKPVTCKLMDDKQ